MRRAILGVILALAGVAPAAASDVEAAVKAAFLPKFAPFVQWPSQAFAAPTDDIVLCAQGDDKVTALAERAAVGQEAWGRKIVVRRLASVKAETGCHLAYLAGSDSQSVSEAIAALKTSAALTITDGARGAPGMINFVREGGRVRFDIDEAAAAECGLVISSKLLSLAREVRRR